MTHPGNAVNRIQAHLLYIRTHKHTQETNTHIYTYELIKEEERRGGKKKEEEGRRKKRKEEERRGRKERKNENSVPQSHH